MESIFLTQLQIKKVRHLTDITIPLSSDRRKHLILTGKNGSGKTSVLLEIVQFLSYAISDAFTFPEALEKEENQFTSLAAHNSLAPDKLESARQAIASVQKDLLHWTQGCVPACTSWMQLRQAYRDGKFILAFYGDTRKIDILSYKNIEKVDLQPVYTFEDKPSRNLGKYLVNLKTTQAFAQAKNDLQRAQEIESWFARFEGILRRIYQDDSLTLDFDVDTFQFSIHLDGREPFAFNTMSMGYSAVFDIISDLMMRMEFQRRYDLEGIVLIDEIETHLHVELQKQIVPILTDLFPNLQFIMTTHSPFILNSTEHAVIYDLENKTLVENGLTNLPYDGIVQGYFGVKTLSNDLQQKFQEYKALVTSPILRDEDYAKIAELSYYLDEVPDYLAVDFAAEYARLKLEFENRG